VEAEKHCSSSILGLIPILWYPSGPWLLIKSEIFTRRTSSCTNHAWHRAMKRDARTVASWDFERIIPCHGVSDSFRLIFDWSPLFSGRYRRKGEGRLDECIQSSFTRLGPRCVFIFILAMWLDCSPFRSDWVLSFLKARSCYQDIVIF